MSSAQPDHRFLIVVLVFGIVATVVGSNWLWTGSIEIRSKGSRVGVGGGRPPVATSPQHKGPVFGRIEAQDLAFYPLCLNWIALGAAMIVLPLGAYFSQKLLFFRLSAFTCLAILLLAGATIALAAWYGP